jgi:beta-glucanase (GH16 family)
VSKREKLMNSTTKPFKLAAIALAAAALITAQSSASQGVTTSPKQATVSKKLLWKQEFTGKSGAKPNSKIFSYDMGGGGWGNNEHQAYTDHNATLTGTGQLALKLKRIPYNPDDLNETCPIDTVGNACEFESARIQTKGKLNFKYGRLEARIKVPVGDGTWPAFWLLGSDISSNAWPNCGEVDIMETKGSEPYTVHGTAHGPGYSGGDGIVNTKTLSSRLGSGYHIYALDWTYNKMVWSVDGKVYHTVTPSVVGNHSYVFNKPMFMILNVAAGGWFAGDIDPDLNSAQMNIDYIRYYSINGQGTMSGTSSAIAAGK